MKPPLTRNAKSTRRALEAFLTAGSDDFLSLFTCEQPIDPRAILKHWWFDALLKAGLLECKGPSRCEASFAIYPLAGMFIVTDCWRYRECDRVFPITHENLCFVGKMRLPRFGLALDIGTGSGVFAIMAATKGLPVVALDVNSRAIAMARFNAELNSVQRHVKLVKGSSALLKGRGVFDYVGCNLPFVPVPPGVSTFLHSAAGHAGRDVLAKVLKDIERLLKPDGVFQMITIDSGTKEIPWILQRRRGDNWLRRSRISLEYLGEPVPLPDWLENMRSTFAWRVGAGAWRDWIGGMRCERRTHAHYFLATVEPGRGPHVEISNCKAYSEEIGALLKALKQRPTRAGK